MRNGKLVAPARKQPLQEKLDIDSEESDLHAPNIICDTDKDNNDFCVDFMDLCMVIVPVNMKL
jgi:hypothetical protein